MPVFGKYSGRNSWKYFRRNFPRYFRTQSPRKYSESVPFSSISRKKKLPEAFSWEHSVCLQDLQPRESSSRMRKNFWSNFRRKFRRNYWKKKNLRGDISGRFSGKSYVRILEKTGKLQKNRGSRIRVPVRALSGIYFGIFHGVCSYNNLENFQEFFQGFEKYRIMALIGVVLWAPPKPAPGFPNDQNI